jgi:hypothetical protein
MALGFRTGGMFGRKPSYERQPWDTPGIGDGFNQRMAEMGDAMPNPSAMPIGIKEMTAKPKFFGQGGAGRAIAGTIGDYLLQQSGMQPIYGPTVLQQRDAEERARMAQQQRMQKREDLQWEWQNKPKDGPQLTEYERIVRASGLPEAEQLKLLQDYARNRANPVQGVPFTDEQGNGGIQFIRPGQMQGAQQGLIPIGGTLPPKGGSGGNVTGGFR